MRAHFIGICGTGMSAVAKLLRESGWQVSGSDEGFYPPISDYLVENNLPCAPRYAAENIPKDSDLIVIGKHAKLVPEENVEVRAAMASGVPIKSFPEVLNQLTASTTNFVVAGSYGKSTCAALAAWALTRANKDPSYFIGALASNLPSNAHIGHGPDFVLEGDEYPAANWDANAKFLYYNPRSVLLTSGEHDHVNVFPTLEAYLTPFVQLLLSLPPNGTVVACLDGANVATILDRAGRQAQTYSLADTAADWRADNIVKDVQTTAFDLVYRTEKITGIVSTLMGEHNIQNMIGVAAWLLGHNLLSPTEVAEAFGEFRGVRRRLELRTPKTKIPVYEDFGSSRAKALAGLRAARAQFPTRRLIVLFEPHTFSFRNRDVIGWYDDLFHDANLVFVYQPPAHGAATHDQLTQDEIVDRVRQTGKTVYPFATKDQLIELLAPMLTPNDAILIETSGDMGGTIQAVVDYVNQTYAAI